MAEVQPQQEEVPTLRNSLSCLRKRPRIALPLTPLIDVTFLLLLYFLLTSTFQEPEQHRRRVQSARGPRRTRKERRRSRSARRDPRQPGRALGLRD